MKIERIWAMPNKNTYTIKPITELLKEEITDGIWADGFSHDNSIRKIIPKIQCITNDLNEDFDTDFHLDALDFWTKFDDDCLDGVLYDPPYSPRQVKECYNNFGIEVTQETTQASWYTKHKKEIARITKVGGKVISFGWNSGGIGKSLGFEIQRILLVPHGGAHHDTIVTVELRIS